MTFVVRRLTSTLTPDLIPFPSNNVVGNFMNGFDSRTSLNLDRGTGAEIMQTAGLSGENVITTGIRIDFVLDWSTVYQEGEGGHLLYR